MTTTDDFKCLFEVDGSGEATGTVMPVCSVACQAKALQTTHKGWRPGVSRSSDFGFSPHCEECGKPIAEVQAKQVVANAGKALAMAYPWGYRSTDSEP